MIWPELHRVEAAPLERALKLDEAALRRELRVAGSFAHHGFTRPQDLRELAALAIALARKLDADDGPAQTSDRYGHVQ